MPARASRLRTRATPETRDAPAEPLDASKSYSLVFETSCGSFTVALDPESAPNTTASLVALAEDGYFDDTIFHRVVPGFVIQGGDPTQSGGGGPGYSTVDPPPSDATYTKGTVAMAKAEAGAARREREPVLRRHRATVPRFRPTTRSSAR